MNAHLGGNDELARFFLHALPWQHQRSLRPRLQPERKAEMRLCIFTSLTTTRKLCTKAFCRHLGMSRTMEQVGHWSRGIRLVKPLGVRFVETW